MLSYTQSIEVFYFNSNILQSLNIESENPCFYPHYNILNNDGTLTVIL